MAPLQKSQMALNSVFPIDERKYKNPSYVSGVPDTRGFLTRIRVSFHSGLSAQTKGQSLVLVPRTADGFRVAVSALWSYDGSKGVSFHAISLTDDLCVRLLFKNLGRQVSEDVVWEELETLGICVQGVVQLNPGHRNQEVTLPRTLLCR